MHHSQSLNFVTDIVGKMDDILDQLGLGDLKVGFNDNKVKTL